MAHVYLPVYKSSRGRVYIRGLMECAAHLTSSQRSELHWVFHHLALAADSQPDTQAYREDLRVSCTYSRLMGFDLRDKGFHTADDCTPDMCMDAIVEWLGGRREHLFWKGLA
jgi:hypothetical protein